MGLLSGSFSSSYPLSNAILSRVSSLAALDLGFARFQVNLPSHVVFLFIGVTHVSLVNLHSKIPDFE
jgi:hypothetical protein